LCYSAEFGDNVYNPADLDLFFEMYRTDQVDHTPTLISVEGGLSLQFASTQILIRRIGDPTINGSIGEANLDIELMMGLLGARQNLSLYQVGQEFTTTEEPSERPLAASVCVWNPNLLDSDFNIYSR
jgi:tripeptidyl-peptidase-1